MTNTEERALWRLEHIVDAIDKIRQGMDGVTFERFSNDFIVKAAFERFIEIISESSRHVPDEWKDEYPDIPWRQVHDIGNILRHAYTTVQLEVLWAIYTEHLDQLELAVEDLLQRYSREP